MLSLLKRYRELIVVSALLLYPFATFLARGRGVREPNFIDRAVVWISAPIQQGIGWLIDGAAWAWASYVDLRGVKAQNDELVTENSDLRRRLQALEEAALENQRLRALLGFTTSHEGREITARVIAVNPVAFPLTIRVNRGSDDGVEKGAAVVTPDGIVGQVVRVTGGYSDVMLVKDPNSRTAVRVQRSRARATAAGAGGDANLILDNLLRTEDLKEGDLIVTSGTDGVFPPGLTVGRATGVRQGKGMFQEAEVVMAVDTSRLEEVLVLPRLEWDPAVPSAQAPGTGGGGQAAQREGTP